MEVDGFSHDTDTPEQSACVNRGELSELVGDPGIGVTDSRSEEPLLTVQTSPSSKGLLSTPLRLMKKGLCH